MNPDLEQRKIQGGASQDDREQGEDEDVMAGVLGATV